MIQAARRCLQDVCVQSTGITRICRGITHRSMISPIVSSHATADAYSVDSELALHDAMTQSDAFPHHSTTTHEKPYASTAYIGRREPGMASGTARSRVGARWFACRFCRTRGFDQAPVGGETGIRTQRSIAERISATEFALVKAAERDYGQAPKRRALICVLTDLPSVVVIREPSDVSPWNVVTL